MDKKIVEKIDRFYSVNFTWDTEGVNPDCSPKIPKKFYNFLTKVEDGDIEIEGEWYSADGSLFCGMSVMPCKARVKKDIINEPGYEEEFPIEVLDLYKPKGFDECMVWAELTEKEYIDLKSGKIEYIEREGYYMPEYIVYVDDNIKEKVEKLMAMYRISVPFVDKMIKCQPCFYRYDNKEKFEKYWCD